MPVRLLNSSVIKWPNRARVEAVLKDWVPSAIQGHPETLRLGYFGSYARGDWGVGSDLDLVAVISETQIPFERRTISWDLSQLPVPTELLVYTEQEWLRLQQEHSRFAQTLATETIWVYSTENEQHSIL